MQRYNRYMESSACGIRIRPSFTTKKKRVVVVLTHLRLLSLDASHERRGGKDDFRVERDDRRRSCGMAALSLSLSLSTCCIYTYIRIYMCVLVSERKTAAQCTCACRGTDLVRRDAIEYYSVNASVKELPEMPSGRSSGSGISRGWVW